MCRANYQMSEYRAVHGAGMREGEKVTEIREDNQMMDNTSVRIRHLDQLQCSTTPSFSNMRTFRTQFVNCSVESVELLIEDNIATSLHLQCPR